MQSLIRTLRRLRDGFTLIELLTVMAVIAILAALILSVSGYATKKGALARAETEIKALEAALESYKTDNGTYPHQPLAISGSITYQPNNGGTQSNIPSDLLDPRQSGNSQYSPNGGYTNASVELYEALTGDLALSGTGGGAGVTNYIRDMRQDVYGRYYSNVPISGTNPVLYLSDPFGNCYGYSTANATATSTGTSPVQGYPSSSAPLPGFNSTYDIWSTGGQVLTPFNGGAGSSNAPGAPGDPMLQWIKNW
jgi:prepilin-type N-terminal cleavage/methylation domain-containing protein